MAIRYYDEALIDKIKNWVKDPKLTVLGTDESTRLFQIRADLNNDKPIALPLVALSREHDVSLLIPHKTPMSFDGKMIWSDGVKSLSLNAIPITLRYQLDIYTRYSDEGDEYLRNFVFNFVNNPKLQITLPYNNTNWTHNSNVILDGNISDNSDIEQKLFGDQFTRWTMGLEINDAYLFSIPKQKNVVLEIGDVEVKED